MTETLAADAVWTCPFCPLACDHLRVRSHGGGLALSGGDCTRAGRGLARLSDSGDGAAAEVDGKACDLGEAIAAAAMRLAASRQPLFAGLGCDVAGARALYPLACATGAICDAAGGDALIEGLRALQDRGQFTTTLAEVRTRADLIVFVGGIPSRLAPLIGLRCGIGDPQVAHRHVVVLGPQPGDDVQLAAWAGPGVTTEAVPLAGDLFATLSWVLAQVSRRPLTRAHDGGAASHGAGPDALKALADRLLAARYGVLVGAPAGLPAPAGLAIETVHQIIGEINRSTRGAALWIGGGDGAATANQVFAWLSGLPLRSRAGPLGLEHEPLVFQSRRLIDGGAVDAVLWVSAFGADDMPADLAAAAGLPLVLLAPAASKAWARRPGAVFIPVATPGIGAAGHLFRTDGTVLMPLHAVRDDGLPTVADVAQRIHSAIVAMRSASHAEADR
jgi:formylmethanofuran dehydrogenase subunit B